MPQSLYKAMQLGRPAVRSSRRCNSHSTCATRAQRTAGPAAEEAELRNRLRSSSAASVQDNLQLLEAIVASGDAALALEALDVFMTYKSMGSAHCITAMLEQLSHLGKLQSWPVDCQMPLYRAVQRALHHLLENGEWSGGRR